MTNAKIEALQNLRSGTLGIYKRWLKTATVKQIEFADRVYKHCEDNYDRGGDLVCESYEPEMIIANFRTVAEARETCQFSCEMATNSRLGSDADPELTRHENSKTWKGA
jgi:hypothetical protein